LYQTPLFPLLVHPIPVPTANYRIISTPKVLSLYQSHSSVPLVHGMPFSPDKTALNQALSTRRHIWPEKMSCNSQSTHNSHFILANQIILFTFAIGFSWQGEASSELIE
jgi:hypothetical protein